MRISQLAKQSEVNVHTLRYYERRGLLPPPKRRPSGYREYSADTIALVRFIKRAQQLGFSLRDVGELIELRKNPAQNCALVRRAAACKLEEVTHKIRRLTTLKKALEQLTNACEFLGNTGCPIIEALNDEDHVRHLAPGRSKVPA